jgi:hypothetical protein
MDGTNLKIDSGRSRVRSHPTRYGGVLFRSRLEARWAAFFDLAGWRWEYEPTDEHGWVPDFFLLPPSGDAIAVEVKPIEWPNDMEKMEEVYKTRPDLEKVRRHTAHDRLVVGAFMPDIYAKYGGHGPTWDACRKVFGLLVSEGWSDGKGGIVPWAEPAVMYEGYGRALDFSAMYGLYQYRMGGEGYRQFKDLERETLDRLWREAGNRTQWRGGAPARRVSLFDD